MRILALFFLVVLLFGCINNQISTEKIEPKVSSKQPIEKEKLQDTDSINDTNITVQEEKTNASANKNNPNNSINFTIEKSVQINNQTINQTPAKVAPKIINGKKLEERLKEASDRLHTQGSGSAVRSDFDDLALVYTDYAQGKSFPPMILPFRYYYSEEANITFNICAIEYTVFICKGKLERVINSDEFNNGRCEVSPVYTGGNGGGYGYGYN
ncbi:MAG: hypothetical protein AABX38_04665 [Candidatus Micrarchaeota archaeon]